MKLSSREIALSYLNWSFSKIKGHAKQQKKLNLPKQNTPMKWINSYLQFSIVFLYFLLRIHSTYFSSSHSYVQYLLEKQSIILFSLLCWGQSLILRNVGQSYIECTFTITITKILTKATHFVSQVKLGNGHHNRRLAPTLIKKFTRYLTLIKKTSVFLVPPMFRDKLLTQLFATWVQ